MRGCWTAPAIALAGCLASPPGAVEGVIDAGGGEPDAAPPLPPVPIELIGDLVTYDCNEVNQDARIAFDRSGGGRHATTVATSPRPDGRYGAAWTMSGGATRPHTARDGALGPGADGLTIEAFVWLETGSQVASIASDYDPAADPPVTFDLQVDNESRMAFATDDLGTENVIFSTELVIPIQTWTHLAVSWDRTTVAFYVDGALVSALPFARTPNAVVDDRFVHFGGRSGGTLLLDGGLDEIKISSYAKSADQIAASMDLDSAELAGRCGDRLVEPTEVCDGQDLCCNDACEPVADDAMCTAAGGSCSGGGCKLGPSPRVASGLVAFYTFADSAGGVVSDEAGAGPPAHLSIVAGSAVQAEGFLRLSEGALLRADATDKIADRCTVSQQLTVEAWVAPADAVQAGPARVATYSNGPLMRNFMLAQSGSMWVARALTEGSDENGTPMIGSGDGDVRAEALTHVVLTVAGEERRLYLDGRLRSVGLMPGDFAGGGWNPDFPLVVGNEDDGSRAWSGDVHLLAVYDRALSEVEVAINFAAGADPES